MFLAMPLHLAQPMPQPKDLAKRGMDTIRTGLDAATRTAARFPGLVRRPPTSDDGSEPREYVIVQDLPDDLKQSYLSVLVWLVHSDDRQIDERELCEIQVLMTQLRCDAEVRQAVRSHLEKPHTVDAETQIARLPELVPPNNPDTAYALKYSLIKDAIRVSRATAEGVAREQLGIRRLAELLDVDDKEVAVIEEACVQEEEILAGNLSDSGFASAAKELASRATAVGVPITAIYLSGSVTGLSAAGIVSGLAALGLGGVLGLSAMVTGIGVAILGGGVAYKGVRWVLGGSERNRGSLRELMLQEILRIHQTAIINLAEDISFFGERVADLAAQTERNRATINRLSREMTLLIRSTGALTRLGERASGFERDLEAVAGHPAQ